MADISLPKGAVQRALELQLFGVFTTRETTLTVNADSKVILNNNPERIGFVIVNSGATLITFSLKRDLVSGTGFILPQHGDTVTSSFVEDGQFPTNELSAISDAAGGVLYILEFIRATL